MEIFHNSVQALWAYIGLLAVATVYIIVHIGR